MNINKPDGNGEGTDNENGSLIIRSSPVIRIIGVGGIAFGCLMSLWCCIEFLDGNGTASVGTSIGFLLIGCSLGIFLILYGSRYIMVQGEGILFRDILLRRHDYCMADIVKVKWSVDGYVFLGITGKLFKIYDDTVNCEILLRELENRGVKVDIPGREFGTGRQAAIEPCRDKRSFTVRSGTCSIRYGGRMEIDGDKLFIRRVFRKDLCCTVPELKRVRIKENKERRITIFLYNSDNELLFKIRGFAGDCRDTHYMFALLRHLAEAGVPLQGLESVDDSVHCRMRNRFVDPREAQAVLNEEYELILPVFREYDNTFADIGFRLVYGMADGIQMEELRRKLFHLPMRDPALASGFVFCLTRDGRLVYDNREELPLYQDVPIMSRRMGPGTDRAAYDGLRQEPIYLEPVPESAIRHMLEHFVGLARSGKIGISDSAFPFP